MDIGRSRSSVMGVFGVANIDKGRLLSSAVKAILGEDIMGAVGRLFRLGEVMAGKVAVVVGESDGKTDKRMHDVGREIMP